MRYLAEVISPDKIAVWFFSDEDGGELKDDLYWLQGNIAYPIFPDPYIFEARVAPGTHFIKEDYKRKIKEWNEMYKEPPPFEWICLPNFRGKYRVNNCNLLAAIERRRPIELQKGELTQDIKNTIVKVFEKEKYSKNHQVCKDLYLGTISKS